MIRRPYQSLQNPALLFSILLYLMLLLIGGTVAQKYIGIFPATHMIFNSYLFWWGIIPLPGAAAALTLLFLSLLSHFITKSRWELASLGTTLAHLSVLILLLGGGITLFMKQEGFMVLRQNDVTSTIYEFDTNGSMDARMDAKGKILVNTPQWKMPFAVSLQDFKQNYYQGTDIAQSYESSLLIKEGPQSWPALIAMNEPFHYKGYTFYQSSVLTLPNKEIASVLNVVKNPGWLFPYIATAMLFAGLALHAALRHKAKFILVAMLLILSSSAQAQSGFDFQSFKELPISHEGRIKPLGRVAQLTLEQISGVNASIDDAASWMANVLFDPAGAETASIFHLDNKNLIHALKLESHENSFYSFQELNNAFLKQADLILNLRQADPKTLSNDQQDLLELYAYATYFEQAKESMTLVLPLKTGKRPSRLIDIYSKQKNDRLMRLLAQRGENNQSLRIIPVKNGSDTLWQAPWQVFLTDTKTPNLLLPAWSDLAKAYITGDTALWNSSSHELYNQAITISGDKTLSFRLKTELFYTNAPLYLYSALLYAAGLILAWFSKQRLALAATGLGLALHGIGIACRMVILQRPPVSDLYESMLFVGALIVSLCFIYAWRKKDMLILMLGAALGVALHLLGFALDDGFDNLKVLQAVLDTKFWLATHVIIITSGYAFCLMTSALAHFHLFRFPVSKKSFQRLYTLTLVSLVFICTGTLLGGVWADQSWGRFWGWDPKENGALLIALWLVWLLHGRISRHVDDFYFTAGLVALSMIVSLSWIGINLLGVGLHSYGFIQGSISTLLGLLAAECAFIFWCIKRRVNHGA